MDPSWISIPHLASYPFFVYIYVPTASTYHQNTYYFTFTRQVYLYTSKCYRQQSTIQIIDYIAIIQSHTPTWLRLSYHDDSNRFYVHASSCECEWYHATLCWCRPSRWVIFMHLLKNLLPCHHSFFSSLDAPAIVMLHGWPDLWWGWRVCFFYFLFLSWTFTFYFSFNFLLRVCVHCSIKFKHFAIHFVSLFQVLYQF